MVRSIVSLRLINVEVKVSVNGKVNRKLKVK